MLWVEALRDAILSCTEQTSLWPDFSAMIASQAAEVADIVVR